MASERDTPRVAASNGAGPKNGVNGRNGARKLASLFGSRASPSADAEVPDDQTDDQSGPAYQHLRETLRDLIGNAEADETTESGEPATQRRLGYASPSRAGITPPPAADDATPAPDAEDADPQTKSAHARSSSTVKLKGEMPRPANLQSADFPIEIQTTNEPTRTPARTGLKAKLRAERPGADAPLIRREQAPAAPPRQDAESRLHERGRERRRIEIDDETHFKTLNEAGGFSEHSAAYAEPPERSYEQIQEQPRGDSRSVSRLRHRRVPQKVDLAQPAETERVDDDDLWTGRSVAVVTPQRSRARLIAFGVGGVLLMGAGIFVGARIFAPSAPNAPAKPAAVAAVPAVVAESEPLALEAVPDKAPVVAKQPAAAVAPAKSVAVVTTETETIANAANLDVTASIAAPPAEPVKLPAAAVEAPAAEAPVDVATTVIPGIAAESAAEQQPDEPIPGVAADTVAADSPADVSAPADTTDAGPADETNAAADDTGAAPVDDASNAAPPADQPPEDNPPAAAPPPETNLAVLSISPRPGAAACEPGIRVSPLPAGFSRIAIAASCMSNELVRFTYGGVVFDRQLDTEGALTFDVDCFLGAREPVAIAFKDGAVYEAVPAALDLEKITKIAVVWNAAVDIDLHAYEYPGDLSAGRHVWASAPASVKDVVQRIRAEQIGAGFMSSVADAHGTGSHVEVYTFVYPLTVGRRPASDLIRFAVDYSTRGSRPAGQACGDGAFASIDYQLLMSVRGAKPKRSLLSFTPLPCEVTIADQVRYNTSAYPELDLSK